MYMCHFCKISVVNEEDSVSKLSSNFQTLMSCEKLQDLSSDEEDSEEEEWLKKDDWLRNEREEKMVIAETTSWKGEMDLKSKDLLLEGNQEMVHEESRGNTDQHAQDEQLSDDSEEQEGSDSLITPSLDHR